MAQHFSVALRKLAKGPPAGQPQVQREMRVEKIAATLRDCTFRNGVTLQAFAAEWGESMDVVHAISAIASKRVRAEVTDPDRVASKGFAMLERIADEAMIDADEKGNNAAHRGIAIRAVDTWMKNSGVVAPTKSVTGVVIGDLSALTDEQLDARAAELVAKLAKAGAK